MKPKLALMVNDVGYLAHVTPIIRHMTEYEPIVMTCYEHTAEYARKYLGVDARVPKRPQDYWYDLKGLGCDKAVTVHQVLPQPIEGIKTVQIFHGVSGKGPNLGNWCPQMWGQVFVQGRHYWEPYTTKYARYVDRIRKCGFTRACYYDDVPAWDKSAPILYMPSHNDSANVVENIRFNLTRLNALGRPIRVSFHPIHLRDEPKRKALMSHVRGLINIEVYSPDSVDYVDYHKRFFESCLYIGDISSTAYEYTLTGKPILQVRGGPAGEARGRGLRALEKYVIPIENGDFGSAIEKALSSRPEYPNLYYKDAGTMIENLREVFND